VAEEGLQSGTSERKLPSGISNVTTMRTQCHVLADDDDNRFLMPSADDADDDFCDADFQQDEQQDRIVQAAKVSRCLSYTHLLQVILSILDSS
jgi:hypothetical protein